MRWRGGGSGGGGRPTALAPAPPARRPPRAHGRPAARARARRADRPRAHGPAPARRRPRPVRAVGNRLEGRRLDAFRTPHPPPRWELIPRARRWRHWQQPVLGTEARGKEGAGGAPRSCSRWWRRCDAHADPGPTGPTAALGRVACAGARTPPRRRVARGRGGGGREAPCMGEPESVTASFGWQSGAAG